MFKRLFRSHAARRRTSWAIALVLILPFVFFFHASMRAPVKGEGGAAGKLFGKSVPWETFDQQRRWTRIQLRARLAGMPEPMLGPLVTQYTWERLMLIDEARRRGLRVDDLELAGTIQHLPEFQQSGRFVPERYHLFLRTVGLPAPIFEENLRNDLLVDKLLQSVHESVTVSDAEVHAAFVQAHEQLTGWATVTEPAAFIEQASRAVTDEEVRQRYETRPDEVRRPEQVAFAYAGLTRDAVAAGIHPADQELKDYYDAHPEEFKGSDGKAQPFEEAREAVRQAATEAQLRKTLNERAMDLEDDLAAKRPFDDIVAARALTTKTAGPLAAGEPTSSGGPEPAIIQAVAELKEGETTGVVQTASGVYLARVTQRIPATVPPLGDVRGQIRERLIRDRARESAKNAAEAIREKLEQRMAAGWRFEEVELADGVSGRSVRFTRTQPIDPVGYERRVNEAAFATPLGQLTPVLETVRGFILLRPEARIPPDDGDFAKEAESLKTDALDRRREERFTEWLGELRERARLESFVDAPAPGG